MTKIFLNARDVRTRKVRARKVRENFSGLRFAMAAFAMLVGLIAAPQRAQAQEFTFSASKHICAGNPAINDPDFCQPIQFAGAGQPVFYVFIVTNATFSSPQQITLDETNSGTNGWPVGFIPGAITCKDQAGNPVAISVNTLSPVGSFWIQSNQRVTCTVEGSFSTNVIGQNVTNMADVIGSVSTTKVDTTVHVSSVTQLDTDLSVTKTVTPLSIDISTGAKTVRYTVIIKNNGQDVDVGHWFVLHDNMRLAPNSVPVFATILPGATCVSSNNPTTHCLDAVPTLTVIGPRLIGTMAPVSMFDWGFAPTQGFIESGEQLTLEWDVKIEQLTGLNCVKALNSDGVINNVFFTLTNPDGTAANDLNNANNTATQSLDVITGNTTIDPNCGDGQLSIEKKQVSPTPSSGPHRWGAGTNTPGTVFYDITIKNTSFPNQAITINGGDFRDYVINGIGTPPFTRTFISMLCMTPSFCTGFSGAPPPPPPFPSPLTSFKYTYYGQSDLGWQSDAGSDLTLPANGDEVTIRVGFHYADPDCDTVPNVDPKLIENIGVITYMATPLGAAGGSPQDVQYTQTAKASTFMLPQKTCKFVVKKKLSNNIKNVKFGAMLSYSVSFTNNDAPRNIGTVMDVLRLTDPSYAPLPYKASWLCNGTGGVSGYSVNGSITSGVVTYTNSPGQGAPVMKQPPTIHFPTGSTLTCLVQITVDRPDFNNARCAAIDVDLENTAIMDVTNPYNSNVPWPPSGTYAGAQENPQPQDKNWATTRTLLPKCFDFIVNKKASVDGVSPAWTWSGGSPIDYSIKVTNTADNGVLTGSGSTVNNWDGVSVIDVVDPPYAGNQIGIGTPDCTGFWSCQPLVPPITSPSPSHVGVLSLAAGASGDWNLIVNPPFTTGEPVINCALIRPSDAMIAGSDWYPNFNPFNDPADPQKITLPTSCTEVPVLEVADLIVTKFVVNQTGAPVSIPSLSFGVNVTCSPWPLPTTSATLTTQGGTLANGAAVSSSPWVVQHVPTSNQCTLSETPPPVPNVSCSVNGVAGTPVWETNVTPSPLQMSAAGPNAVQVTNILRCEAEVCDCDDQCLFKIPFYVVDGDICVTWAILCCLITILLLLLILFLQWIILLRTWRR